MLVSSIMSHELPSMIDLIQSVGPPSFGRSAELFGVAQKVFSLSGARSGNKVVILTDTRTHKEIVDAFFGAGLSLGADTVVLMSRPMKSLGDPNEWVLNYLKSADLVVNLLSMEWGKQPGAKSLLDAGTRVIMCAETPNTLLKMPPDEKVMRRVERFVDLIDRSNTVRMKSAGGTDIQWRKREGGKAAYLNGVLEPTKKVKWTNFPNSVVNYPFDLSSGKGTIVMDPGDAVLHLAYLLREPVRITVDGSKIVEIKGGVDAELLHDKWFNRWRDPLQYELLHLSLGCDHRAEVLPGVFAPMEWESYAGGCLFGFGPNTHLDVMLRKQNVWFNETQIIKEGELVHPDLL
jgi:2,5-dihydroxypyridine 5,6-dioxygenase